MLTLHSCICKGKQMNTELGKGHTLRTSWYGVEPYVPLTRLPALSCALDAGTCFSMISIGWTKVA